MEIDLIINLLLLFISVFIDIFYQYKIINCNQLYMN